MTTPASPIAVSRYNKPRKADYTVGAATETFVVPILRDRITRLLDEHCGPLPKPARVLDVGCGRQPFRAQLEALGCDYTGFDVQQTPEGSVAFLGVLDGPLPPGLADPPGYDFLLCTEVLEHVADWGAAFRNLAALAPPGARVLITCPFFYLLHEEPYDFWRPTFHALERYAAAHGFRVVSREAAGDCWDVLGTLLASCAARSRRPGFRGRLGSKVVNGCRRLVFWLLKKRWLQRLADLHGPLYTCNIAMLEKA
ncbi:Methyltransferase domain protein OS=Chloracidobacterium thermophilum (strain B) GN=Cabther_A1609 PE=4 SV=1: Methyltransf_23 [Gemmataceae bacterium]|nr:Methyltransferase domain protein OS=Chloracidobacterium thermophilum (strain B) GN=Cabther_A1609 PE=4 SV=1: Methyltransf_23 [Gemmataceae bacterium]VTU00938.1 Methyltransferase domain protein OS=Chloracidobacterium thermophilum (strain B) GN=Cabther_A1609 PE=4 SV=1: Methyltransf_23 [Gemmataceae bacterium]